MALGCPIREINGNSTKKESLIEFHCIDTNNLFCKGNRYLLYLHLPQCLKIEIGVIRHFGNENDTGTEYGVASVCGIVWGNT